MGRIILPYGAIAGAVTIGTMIAFTLPSEDGVGGSVWLGFLVMILALSVIYLGIRRYRDHELGGVIRFRTGVLLGLGITLVAGTVYVAAWEVYLSVTDYAFIDGYTEAVIAGREAEGMDGAAPRPLHPHSTDASLHGFAADRLREGVGAFRLARVKP